MNRKYTFMVYSFLVILAIAAAGCMLPAQEPDTVATAAPVRTPIPADMTCSIWEKTAAYNYNGFAFTFSQKNPPMFINYTLMPKNETVNRVYTDPNTDKTVTLTYSDFKSSSWFEVTVKDNTTGEVILQDGFGKTKGYPTYLSRTLKILKAGDLLVEIRGNDITAATTIWVKPAGNVDESRMMEFTRCMNWEGNRDSLAPAKTTTREGVIYTWTPENQVTG